MCQDSFKFKGPSKICQDVKLSQLQFQGAFENLSGCQAVSAAIETLPPGQKQDKKKSQGTELTC